MVLFLSRVGVLLTVKIGIALGVVLLLRVGEALFHLNLPQGSMWIGGFLAGMLCELLPFDRWLRIGRYQSRS